MIIEYSQKPCKVGIIIIIIIPTLQKRQLKQRNYIKGHTQISGRAGI